LKTEILKISGMSCPHCVMAVKEELENIEGLRIIDVQIGLAEVEYETDEVDRHRLKKAVEEAGFVLEN
jgi:copper chaperone CopZ